MTSLKSSPPKILAIRTDRDPAEISLLAGEQEVAKAQWPAQRMLARQLNEKILVILNKSSITLEDLEGVVIFSGPGSFTGLRIGFSAANALAWGLDIPIISAGGENWIKQGVSRIIKGQNNQIALPNYGAPARTTKPKK